MNRNLATVAVALLVGSLLVACHATARNVADLPSGQAADLKHDEIVFVCIRNPYMEHQFKLWIADDVHGQGKRLECKDSNEVVIPHQRGAKNKSRSLWLITPTLARDFRATEFDPAGNLLSIKPLRKVGFGIAATDLDGEMRSWKVGNMKLTLSDGRVYIGVTDIFEAAKSKLAALNGYDFLQPRGHGDLLVDWETFRVFQKAGIASLRSYLLSAVYEVEPSISEMDATVHIISCVYGDNPGTGTGFFVEDGDMNEGSNLILTNYHVVKCASENEGRVLVTPYAVVGQSDPLASTPSGDYQKMIDESHSVVIFYDKRRDLALIRTHILGQEPLELYSDSAAIKPGDEVLALGHPLGHNYFVTKGIVSRIITNCGDHLDIPEYLKPTPLRCIQTDASINFGNSGGPLLSADKRQVVGVSTALVSQLIADGTAVREAGLATAIHHAEVRAFLLEAGVVDR